MLIEYLSVMEAKTNNTLSFNRVIFQYIQQKMSVTVILYFVLELRYFLYKFIYHTISYTSIFFLCKNIQLDFQSN